MVTKTVNTKALLGKVVIPTAKMRNVLEEGRLNWIERHCPLVVAEIIQCSRGSCASLALIRASGSGLTVRGVSLELSFSFLTSAFA
jgi:hypothetical protein